ncbi:MAG: type VII toxin-antitoxin system HepT family RNase toxin [Thermodesulfovibrionales bacterium]
MNIDRKRINQYLYEIRENTDDIKNILNSIREEEILSNKNLLKALKFSLIEISEAISLVLQHLLAKEYGTPVKGYIDTIKKAHEKNIIDEQLYNALKPFFDFRNTLIHRYWEVNDTMLLKNLKRNYQKFYDFIDIITDRFKEKT